MPERKHNSRKNIPMNDQPQAAVPTKSDQRRRSAHRAPPSTILSQPTTARINALSTQGKKKRPK